MAKPTTLHEIQKLGGRVAALSRFVAWLGEKALLFYALMKKSDKSLTRQRRQIRHLPT
jgi:hypothetical protein